MRLTTFRLRRSLVTTIVAAGMALGGANTALAQDSLPDPNKPKTSKTAAKQSRSGDLPSTGIEASWLTLAGVALLAGGLAVRPVARRRRSYRTDTWRHIVRSGS